MKKLTTIIILCLITATATAQVTLATLDARLKTAEATIKKINAAFIDTAALKLSARISGEVTKQYQEIIKWLKAETYSKKNIDEMLKPVILKTDSSRAELVKSIKRIAILEGDTLTIDDVIISLEQLQQDITDIKNKPDAAPALQAKIDAITQWLFRPIPNALKPAK